MSKNDTVKFEYDDKKRLAILSGSHFEEIREHFSVMNEGAKYARFKNRFAPSRKYVVTPTGRFDPGMYFEIRRFLKENAKDTRVVVSERLKEVVYPSYRGVYTAPRPKLSLELRDYQ